MDERRQPVFDGRRDRALDMARDAAASLHLGQGLGQHLLEMPGRLRSSTPVLAAPP